MVIYSRWNCLHSVLKVARSNIKQIMQRYRFYTPWLEHRLTLFKTFTYPSVLAQTNQNFTWIGLVHKDSPKWFIEELKHFDRMEIKLVEYDIEEAIRGEASVNLDTDDAISRNFIEEALNTELKGETIFSHGLKYRAYTDFWLDDIYHRAHFNIINHPIHTVLDFEHGKSGLVQQVIKTPDPRWIEVIHEKNLGNKLRVPHSHKTKTPRESLGVEHAKKYFEFNSEMLTIEHLIANFDVSKLMEIIVDE